MILADKLTMSFLLYSSSSNKISSKEPVLLKETREKVKEFTGRPDEDVSRTM